MRRSPYERDPETGYDPMADLEAADEERYRQQLEQDSAEQLADLVAVMGRAWVLKELWRTRKA